MKKTILLFALSAFAVTMVSCQRTPTRENLHHELLKLHSKAASGTDTQAVKAGEEALKMMDIESIRDSGELVTSGEDNFAFEAFDESLRIFEMARLKNPANEKANGYLALLTPLGHLKGLYWRTSASKNDDEVGAIILRSYRLSLNEGTMQRFFFEPYKDKLVYWKDVQKEIVRPFSRDLLNSSRYWEKAHGLLNLDISLYLPKAMSNTSAMRIRNADAQVAASMALGLATYARLYSIYDFGDAKLGRSPEHEENHSPKTDWEDATKDSRFGLLVDTEFYSTIKDRYLEFAQGVDLAYVALKQREQKGENDLKDFVQINKGSVIGCSSTAEDSRLSFENYSCSSPREMPLPYIFSFFGSTERGITEDIRGYNYQISFDPTVESLRASVELFKHALFGPIQAKKTCTTENSGVKEVSYWIDFPDYLQNPLKDLKGAGPLFDSLGEISDFKDHTLHGLFPQGVPCAH